MPRIDAATLPPAHEIDPKPIREAAERYAVAQESLRDKQRTLVKLENTGRDAAQALDAEEAADALATGKPVPRRKNEAEYEKALDQAEHEVRVAQVVARRALEAFQAVTDEHAESWAADLARRLNALDAAWSQAVAQLDELHHERMELSRRSRVLGAEVAPIGAIKLRPDRLHDIEVAYSPDPIARAKQRAVVTVDDTLEALRTLGQPEEPAPMPGSGVADALKRSLEHAQSVRRGFAPDEGEKAPWVRQAPPRTFVTPDGATFYEPGGDGGEE